MIIKPRIRGFVCITAHPEGCAAHVKEQIAHVRAKGPIENSPKRVLVIGSSTGYGLSARIVSAFGCGADTLGIFFERPSSNGKPASAGWYNSVAFEEQAQQAGLWAKSLNGDAFSDDLKEQAIAAIKEKMGQVDLVVYSLASPRRTDPKTGETFRSTLKPIGEPYTAKNLDTDKKQVHDITIEPATQDEIDQTVKVMGGEDWELWIHALNDAGVLAPGATTCSFDYIGPEVTWPVYTNGSIGQAKKHLRTTADKLDAMLKVDRGRAFVSVNKAVVTQASSAIPVVPLYISILFKVMKEKGLHEDCIHQIDRLFREQMFDDGYLRFDDEGRVRVDDLEMREDVQQAVKEIWPQVTTETIDQYTDFGGYQENFLRLFGFGLKGVDYEADVDPVREFPA